MLNIEVKQKIIIRFLAFAILLFSLVGQYLSIYKVNSLLYCLMGCVLAIIIYIKASKIQLFSPVYNVFASIFFTFIFSGLYYFAFPFDVLNRNILTNDDTFGQINLLYSLFFLSIFIPIIVFLFSKRSYVKNKIFSASIPKYNINIKLFIMNFIFILWIIIALAYSGMTLLAAMQQPLVFRIAVSNGSISILQTFFLFCISGVYVIYLKEIFTKSHYINIFNKLLFWSIVIIWSIICGSRFFLIFIIMFMFMAIYTIFQKIKFIHILIALLGILFALLFSSVLLIYRMMGTNLNYINFEKQFKNINLLEDFAERNDTFANSIQFFKLIEYKNGTIIYFTDYHYQEELLNHMTKYLPKNIRTLFKSGNFDLFTLKMSKIFAPRAVETNTTFSFGAISNIFWNFGIWGLIIIGALFGCFTVLLEMLFNRYKHNEIFLLVYFTILTKFLSNFFAIGIINCPLTMELIYTLPLLCLLIIFFKSKKNITIKF